MMEEMILVQPREPSPLRKKENGVNHSPAPLAPSIGTNSNIEDQKEENSVDEQSMKKKASKAIQITKDEQTNKENILKTSSDAVNFSDHNNLAANKSVAQSNSDISFGITTSDLLDLNVMKYSHVDLNPMTESKNETVEDVRLITRMDSILIFFN